MHSLLTRNLSLRVSYAAVRAGRVRALSGNCQEGHIWRSGIVGGLASDRYKGHVNVVAQNYAGLMPSRKTVFLSTQPTNHPRIEINGDLLSEGLQGSDRI